MATPKTTRSEAKDNGETEGALRSLCLEAAPEGGEPAKIAFEEKARTRQAFQFGTVRGWIEEHRSYPAFSTIQGFPNLFIEEAWAGRPFGVLSSFPGNGFGILRRKMQGKPLEVEEPSLPEASKLPKGSLSRFLARARLVPVCRRLRGISLNRRHQVVLLKENGTAACVGSFVTGSESFLRNLKRWGDLVGSSLDGELLANFCVAANEVERLGLGKGGEQPNSIFLAKGVKKGARLLLERGLLTQGEEVIVQRLLLLTEESVLVERTAAAPMLGRPTRRTYKR